MGRRGNLGLLLALLGTSTGEPIDGETLSRRLAANGTSAAPSKLLAHALSLEASGHVQILRDDGYRFRLTPLGEEAAYELGPGEPIELALVMVDLVGFVAFTAEHGDQAAHHAARDLQDLADVTLQRAGGRLVKPLGDGFLGAVPTSAEGVDTVRHIAQRSVRPDGGRWSLRAAVHRGRPIVFRGDLFGADVNLTARLCASARPGELVMTADPAAPGAEPLEIRGLRDPIAVTRMALA